MAKELEKFQSDYKKLATKIKDYSPANATNLKTRLNSASTNCGEGERNLADLMVDARKKGVTGDTLEDFKKDKGFAEGLKLLRVANDMLAEELQTLKEFSVAAAKALIEVKALDTAIAKDLKARSSLFSSSKKEIATLQQDLAKDIKGLTEAAGKYDAVEPYKKTLPDKFDKTVADILKQAPAAQEKRQEAEMLPQLLVDRNLKSNLSKAQAWAKSIATAISEALDEAGDDMVAAATKIKAAAEDLKPLSKMHADYQKLVKEYGQAIEISKDKAKIEKAIAAIEDAYTTSATKIRGAATTMKKAK